MESQEPPVVDPDNIPETLCVGRVNLSPGPGPLATLIFTNVRAKAGPLIDANIFEHENVVRARIVTTLDELVALRDLLNKTIQQSSTPSAGQGPYRIN
jgi:hypothetical protein